MRTKLKKKHAIKILSLDPCYPWDSTIGFGSYPIFIDFRYHPFCLHQNQCSLPLLRLLATTNGCLGQKQRYGTPWHSAWNPWKKTIWQTSQDLQFWGQTIKTWEFLSGKWLDLTISQFWARHSIRLNQHAPQEFQRLDEIGDMITWGWPLIYQETWGFS